MAGFAAVQHPVFGHSMPVARGEEDTTRALAAEAVGHGLQMVDALVPDGAEGAAARTLGFMAGGDVDAYDRTFPAPNTMGSKVARFGGAAAGQAVKVDDGDPDFPAIYQTIGTADQAFRTAWIRRVCRSPVSPTRFISAKRSRRNRASVGMWAASPARFSISAGSLLISYSS